MAIRTAVVHAVEQAKEVAAGPKAVHPQLSGGVYYLSDSGGDAFLNDDGVGNLTLDNSKLNEDRVMYYFPASGSVIV